MEDYLLSVTETAKRLKTNRNYVYTLIKAGLLKSLKVGSLKVRNLEINRFIAEYEGRDVDSILSEQNYIEMECES